MPDSLRRIPRGTLGRFRNPFGLIQIHCVCLFNRNPKTRYNLDSAMKRLQNISMRTCRDIFNGSLMALSDDLKAIIKKTRVFVQSVSGEKNEPTLLFNFTVQLVERIFLFLSSYPNFFLVGSYYFPVTLLVSSVWNLNSVFLKTGTRKIVVAFHFSVVLFV